MAFGGLHHSHVLQLVPSLLIGLVLNSLLVLPLRSLVRLRCYYAAVGAPTGSKRVRARRGAKKDEDIDLGGAETLVLAPLTIQQAGQLTYRGAFENLFIVSLFALSSTVVSLLAERLLGWPASSWPALLAFSTSFVALAMMAQVDLLSSTTSPSNKALAVFWGVGGFAVALALHVLQPGGGGMLAWDTQQAAAAIGPTLKEAVRLLGSKALKEGVAPIPDLTVAASALQVLLALVAAAVSVLLYAPALRFVHSYWLQLNPPEWAGDYIEPRLLAAAGMHLQLMLPLLSSLLWVRPMSQELLGLSDQQLVFAQVGALLATAAVIAAGLRSLLQRYLDRALTGWHHLKHGSLVVHAKKDDKRSLGDLIRASCEAIHLLLGKAAVQLLAPATFYLGLGLLLLQSALHPGSSGSMAAQTRVLVQSCVGFLAAWTGACWFVYCTAILWMFRTGVIQA